MTRASKVIGVAYLFTSGGIYWLSRKVLDSMSEEQRREIGPVGPNWKIAARSALWPIFMLNGLARHFLREPLTNQVKSATLRTTMPQGGESA